MCGGYVNVDLVEIEEKYSVSIGFVYATVGYKMCGLKGMTNSDMFGVISAIVDKKIKRKNTKD